MSEVIGMPSEYPKYGTIEHNVLIVLDAMEITSMILNELYLKAAYLTDDMEIKITLYYLANDVDKQRRFLSMISKEYFLMRINLESGEFKNLRDSVDSMVSEIKEFYIRSIRSSDFREIIYNILKIEKELTWFMDAFDLLIASLNRIKVGEFLNMLSNEIMRDHRSRIEIMEKMLKRF